MTDGELLAAYRDTPCPKCQYNLRGVTDGKCPKCGKLVELEVSRRHWLPLWWKLTLLTAWLLVLTHVLVAATLGLWWVRYYASMGSFVSTPYVILIAMNLGISLGCLIGIVRAARLKKSNVILALGNLKLTLYVSLWVGFLYGIGETIYWFFAY